MSVKTVFDNILDGTVPVDVVYENEYVLAFRDINPVAPVHVLVIPKRKTVSIVDIGQADTEYMGRFFQAIPQVAALCGLNKDGYRVVVNHGRHGQQTVEYLHAHIIGGRQLAWPPG